MVWVENKTEELLLSITEIIEAHIKQTHNVEETLEIELKQPRQTFHFNTPIWIERAWMLGLTNLEVYNSVFNLTEENNKFEL